jgi:NAD(P)-dependent dehydrogenase (short-subunit alcohol dehydrogenase family)
MPGEPNSSCRSLQGQVAVVTGAGRGIGRAVAQALAAEGTYVAALARSATELAQTVALIEHAGGRARALSVDVTDELAIRATLAEVEKSAGSVDLLVNNAGMIGPLGPFWENDFAEWSRALDVNLIGPLLCAHTILPGMIARRRGRIINVASGAGAMPFEFFSSYVVGKTGLVRFTENLASEIKTYGLSAFAITPGTVRTSMAEYSLNSEAGKKWLPWFGRIFDEGLDLPPERAANLVVALASGKADALSGCFISVHDDLNLLLENIEKIKSDNFYSLRIRKLEPDAPHIKFMPKPK